MAVVSVKEIHEGRGGDGELDAKNRRMSRKHTRRFRVITNSPYDGSYTVLAALPAPATRHPEDFYSIAVKAKADNDPKSKMIWTCSVEYSNERQTPSGGPQNNPLADAAECEWSTDTTQEAFTQDKNGNAILNSAGDYYEDVIKDDVSHWTVSIKKNVAFVPAWINTYRDAVNSDAVVIDGYAVAAGTAKIRSIKIGKWLNRNDIWYRELDFAIKIKSDWKHYPLDQGLRCKWPADNTKRVRCWDDQGRPVTKPVLLDGNGAILANPSPTNAVFNTVDLRNSKPFSVLPLT